MRIGELARASETTTKTVRFYEARGLLPAPPRTPGGYRDFAPETADRLSFIRRGRSAGLTLAQIRQVLDVHDTRQAPCARVQQLLDDRLTDLDTQIAVLQALRVSISNVRDTVAAAPTEHTSHQVCPHL